MKLSVDARSLPDGSQMFMQVGSGCEDRDTDVRPWCLWGPFILSEIHNSFSLTSNILADTAYSSSVGCYERIALVSSCRRSGGCGTDFFYLKCVCFSSAYALKKTKGSLQWCHRRTTFGSPFLRTISFPLKGLFVKASSDVSTQTVLLWQFFYDIFILKSIICFNLTVNL